MTDTKTIKTIVKKRYSIRDNAIYKSVSDTGMDVSTGRKKEDSAMIDINKVGSKDFSSGFLKDSINIIESALLDNDFYNNLRNVNFDGCEVKELEKGFNIVKKSLNQAKQKNRVWFDYDIIIDGYNKNDDFNAYILGVYYGLRAYTIEHILILDKTFKIFNEKGMTKYDSFFTYCKELNFVKNNNGCEVIDEDRYQRGLNDMLFKTKLLDD